MIDAESPNFADSIKNAMRYQLAGIHTSFPGKVLEYKASKQQATIQPLIKKVYADKLTESYPAIVNVPVIFPRTANSIISLPVKKDDLVLVIITERSIDQWLEKAGEESTPISNRRFDLSDAVAIPGLYPFGNLSDADANSILIKNGLTTIKIDDDGKLEMGSASAQLLDILDQTLTELQVLQVIITTGSSAGTYPISPANVVNLLAIQQLLTSIRGSL